MQIPNVDGYVRACPEHGPALMEALALVAALAIAQATRDKVSMRKWDMGGLVNPKSDGFYLSEDPTKDWP